MTDLKRHRPSGRAAARSLADLLLLILIAASHGAFANEAPVIVVREAAVDGSLLIGPVDALELDLTGFRFEGRQPDTIVLHVQDFGRSDYYALSYDPQITRYHLDAGTLRPVAGATSFEGLPAGGSAYLLFGREAWPGSLDSGAFGAELSIQLRIQEAP
jgi:hypothetical protein